MASDGFEERFRECLGSEDFEEKIENFMHLKAATVLKESQVAESKNDHSFQGGEFSLKAHSIWGEYLRIIENHMEEFQESEGLSARQFKAAVEGVGEKHPFLVKLMIASWEFPQFLEMCSEYVEGHDDCIGSAVSCDSKGGKYDDDDEDDDGKDSK
ncbi:unnamed protein product [Symbiodinium microadriaticum]|nr:unnamed protein product [Symbiodinium microadriaticum]